MPILHILLLAVSSNTFVEFHKMIQIMLLQFVLAHGVIACSGMTRAQKVVVFISYELRWKKKRNWMSLLRT